MERNRIGPYQRPAPPKRRPGPNSLKTIQTPAVPLHEIQAQEQRLLENIKSNGNVLGVKAKAKKPGRPSVHEEPMTAAERQARRRAFQAREQGIRDTLRISDGKGKSRLEAAAGGYGSTELDVLASHLGENEEGTMTRGCRRISPKPAGDDRSDGGEASSHRVQVRGLQFGDEESNRVRFAEGELKKIVNEYFTFPSAKAPSASWIAKHDGNVSLQCHERPSFTLTCRMCGDVMGFIEEAVDHLRADHKKTITEWFRNLEPPREFRDMGVFVTVVTPRKRKKSLK